MRRLIEVYTVYIWNCNEKFRALFFILEVYCGRQKYGA